MVQNIIDAITNGFLAQQLQTIPDAVRGLALQRTGWTPEQFQANLNGSEQALISAGLLIVLFAAARAFFAYSQNFNAERVSQSIAFDFRNDLYTKIQRLSFSYHDQNQTGQLMIRATDDVEKVRMFIAQGLLMSVQSIVMLVGALLLLSATNFELMLVILPVLPVAFVMFMIFGRVSQPLFMKAQQKLSTPQHGPAGKPGRHQGGQSLWTRARAADSASTMPPDDQMEPADPDRAGLLFPVPGGLSDRQPGPIGHPLFWRAYRSSMAP